MSVATQSKLTSLFEGRTIDYVEEFLAGVQDGRHVRGQLKFVFTDGTHLLITASESEVDNSPLLDLQVQL